jgi:hypothetical protein
MAATAAIALGGGFGGLGQITGEPSLPDTGSPDLRARTARGVDVAAVLPTPVPASAAGVATGGGAPSASAPAPSPGGTSPGTVVPGPQSAPPGVVPSLPGGEAPSNGRPAPSSDGSRATPAPQQGPAQQVIDTTRGVGNSLPPSVAPVTNEVLNMVLGPPKR